MGNPSLSFFIQTTAACPCWLATTMGVKMVKVHGCLFGSGWEVKPFTFTVIKLTCVVKKSSRACVHACRFVMSCVLDLVGISQHLCWNSHY